LPRGLQNENSGVAVSHTYNEWLVYLFPRVVLFCFASANQQQQEETHFFLTGRITEYSQTLSASSVCSGKGVEDPCGESGELPKLLDLGQSVSGERC